MSSRTSNGNQSKSYSSETGGRQKACDTCTNEEGENEQKNSNNLVEQLRTSPQKHFQRSRIPIGNDSATVLLSEGFQRKQHPWFPSNTQCSWYTRPAQYPQNGLQQGIRNPWGNQQCFSSTHTNHKYTNQQFTSFEVDRPSSSGSSYSPRQRKVYEDERWRKKQFIKPKKRHWEWTKLGFELGMSHGVKPKEGFTFSVMSYNILAQDLLERNLFLYDDNGFLHWDYRRHAIIREMQALSPEIVCLQEVNEKHYRNFLLPEMSRLGFEGIYKKRLGDKEDGCAIFYARDKFLPEVITPLSFAKEGSILNRDNVAIVVKFKALQTGEHICVANTHLLYNPKRGDIKLGQLMILLAEIDKLAVDDKHCYIPTILCGDFNSEPFSDIYNLVQTGTLQYEGLLIRKMSGQRDGNRGVDKFLDKNFLPMSINISDSCQYVDVANSRTHILSKSVQNQTVTVSQKVSAVPLESCVLQNNGSISHKMNFLSVYNHFLTERERGLRFPEVSTHHRSGSATVDYLFYNVLQKNLKQKRWGTDVVDIKEGSLKLLGKLQLLTSKDLNQTGCLPNKYYPSDHLPLVAKFWLK